MYNFYFLNNLLANEFMLKVNVTNSDFVNQISIYTDLPSVSSSFVLCSIETG